MNSLFIRNFVIYALVICLGFGILGSAFVYQVNRFALEEKQAQLTDAADRALQSTSTYFELEGSDDWKDKFNTSYRVSMHMIAKDCDGTILVGSREGDLLFIATRDGCYSQLDNGLQLPPAALETVLREGSYTQSSNFYGFLAEVNYVMGRTVEEDGAVLGVVFTCVPAQSTEQLFLNLSRVFILMTLIVLLLTLLATILVTRSTVRPLKEIAFAARRFTQGDFSARARLPRRQDELYDMTISFNRMAEAMQNTEETRRGLIASVSHDLRTPMTTIAGFVDGILDGTIKPEKQEYYLRIISDEVKRLSRLANSLLTMSRLESGGEERTVFDSSEMIRRIIIGFEQQLKEKKIRLELDLPETLTLKAEHDSFFQAVYNLVDNAVKFTPAGGSITIYLEEKNAKLQFNIVNTGSEIPREMQKHIFDRFYKGDTSRSRNSTGSGLGLYITRTVIQRHGGDIYVRSGEGRTEFCFTVPRNL